MTGRDRTLNFSKRPTIKEVAQAAGVSTQTVSRVINDRPDVAGETREKINRVIEELGYQPSALARSLIQQRSYTLGVVTAGLKHMGPSRTLNGITFQSEKMGYSLLLKELPRFDTENIKPLLQNLLSHHVDGILWAVPQVGDNRSWLNDELPDLPIPIVFSRWKPPGLTIISFDNFLQAAWPLSTASTGLPAHRSYCRSPGLVGSRQRKRLEICPQRRGHEALNHIARKATGHLPVERRPSNNCLINTPIWMLFLWATIRWPCLSFRSPVKTISISPAIWALLVLTACPNPRTFLPR
jgi:transcriptional regulator with XRE-family HTH domain